MTPALVKLRARVMPSTLDDASPPLVPDPASVRPTGDKSSEGVEIARGSGYSLLARLAMAVSRGVGLVLISRSLGSELFGDYSLLIAAFAISSSVGTLGLDQAHIYFTYPGVTRCSR